MVLAHLIEEQKAGRDVEDLGYQLVWYVPRFACTGVQTLSSAFQQLLDALLSCVLITLSM